MLVFQIDVAGIAAQFKEFKDEVETDLNKGVARLAASIWGKILEDSQQELHSTREIYRQALNDVVEVSPGVHLIALDGSAMWIEEGRKSGDMKEDLLRNPKHYANGKKYKVVPFVYNKAPSSMTGFAKHVSSKIQKELKKQGVPWAGVEHRRGKPIMGKVHNFDFGGPIPGKGNTPVMKGVSIYQGMQGGNVRKDILTFRTVTEDQAGKWLHPGLQPKHFFEKALTWGENEWDQTMLPEIVTKWEGR